MEIGIYPSPLPHYRLLPLHFSFTQISKFEEKTCHLHLPSTPIPGLFLLLLEGIQRPIRTKAPNLPSALLEEVILLMENRTQPSPARRMLMIKSFSDNQWGR
jgi:hypothetical protein